MPQEHFSLTQGNTKFTQSVSFVSSLARGFIQGYKKGMYREANYKVSEQCFGTDTQSIIIRIFTSWGTPAFDWGQEIVDIQKMIMLVTDWCEYDEALYQYLTFCYQGEACMIPNMFQAILKKVFQVTTVANDVAQLFMEGLPMETDAPSKVLDFADRLGQNAGKLLRYATDFDPSLAPLA